MGVSVSKAVKLHMVVPVYADDVGRLIGTGGKNIRELMQTSKAQVSAPPKNAEPDEEGKLDFEIVSRSNTESEIFDAVATMSNQVDVESASLGVLFVKTAFLDVLLAHRQEVQRLQDDRVEIRMPKSAKNNNGIITIEGDPEFVERAFYGLVELIKKYPVVQMVKRDHSNHFKKEQERQSRSSSSSSSTSSRGSSSDARGRSLNRNIVRGNTNSNSNRTGRNNNNNNNNSNSNSKVSGKGKQTQVSGGRNTNTSTTRGGGRNANNNNSNSNSNTGKNARGGKQQQQQQQQGGKKGSTGKGKNASNNNNNNNNTGKGKAANNNNNNNSSSSSGKNDAKSKKAAERDWQQGRRSLYVPDHSIGVVYGFNGEKLAELEKSTGVRAMMRFDRGTCLLKLEGSKDNVEAAANQVQASIDASKFLLLDGDLKGDELVRFEQVSARHLQLPYARRCYVLKPYEPKTEFEREGYSVDDEAKLTVTSIANVDGATRVEKITNALLALKAQMDAVDTDVAAKLQAETERLAALEARKTAAAESSSSSSSSSDAAADEKKAEEEGEDNDNADGEEDNDNNDDDNNDDNDNDNDDSASQSTTSTSAATGARPKPPRGPPTAQSFSTEVLAQFGLLFFYDVPKKVSEEEHTLADVVAMVNKGELKYEFAEGVDEFEGGVVKSTVFDADKVERYNVHLMLKRGRGEPVNRHFNLYLEADAEGEEEEEFAPLKVHSIRSFQQYVHTEDYLQWGSGSDLRLGVRAASTGFVPQQVVNVAQGIKLSKATGDLVLPRLPRHMSYIGARRRHTHLVMEHQGAAVEYVQRDVIRHRERRGRAANKAAGAGAGAGAGAEDTNSVDEAGASSTTALAGDVEPATVNFSTVARFVNVRGLEQSKQLGGQDEWDAAEVAKTYGDMLMAARSLATMVNEEASTLRAAAEAEAKALKEKAEAEAKAKAQAEKEAQVDEVTAAAEATATTTAAAADDVATSEGDAGLAEEVSTGLNPEEVE